MQCYYHYPLKWSSCCRYSYLSPVLFRHCTYLVIVSIQKLSRKTWLSFFWLSGARGIGATVGEAASTVWQKNWNPKDGFLISLLLSPLPLMQQLKWWEMHTVQGGREASSRGREREKFNVWVGRAPPFHFSTASRAPSLSLLPIWTSAREVFLTWDATMSYCCILCEYAGWVPKELYLW